MQQALGELAAGFGRDAGLHVAPRPPDGSLDARDALGRSSTSGLRVADTAPRAREIRQRRWLRALHLRDRIGHTCGERGPLLGIRRTRRRLVAHQTRDDRAVLVGVALRARGVVT